MAQLPRRVRSSQLLSPEPMLEGGRPTGTLLVAEVRRLSRARTMGIGTTARSRPTEKPTVTTTNNGGNTLNSPHLPSAPSNQKHPNSMPEDDSSSETSSELDIQHTPTAQSRIHSLLYAGSHSPTSRPSPAAKARGQLLVDRGASVPEVPEELLSNTHHGQMPSSFANLLALHNALEKALLLHLATQGANAAMTIVDPSPQATCSPQRTPPEPSSRDERMKTPEPAAQRSRRALTPEQEEDTIKTFRLESLVSWPVIKPIVERGSGKNFGERELAQLLWLWQNDPDEHLPEEQKTRAGKRKADSSHANLQQDQNSAPQADVGEAKEQVGMGFIISRTRSLDPCTSLETKRLRYTYGLGLEIKARENRPMPSYSLQSPGKTNEYLESPSRSYTSTEYKQPRKSPNKIKAKDVMNLVALWSSKSVDRKAEVARRLRSYWLSRSQDLPQKTVSSPAVLQRISIPLGNLPKLEQALHTQLVHHPFNRPTSASTSHPTPHSRPDLKRHRLDLTRNSEPTHPSPPKRSKVDSHPCAPSSKVPAHTGPHNTLLSHSSPGSIQHRALSLLERIKAKEEKQAILVQQPSPTTKSH
ncbi:hypothetical protein PCASD_12419 [Puccinia coronata f. sp. avenae]|uniref:Uncharacterized protein n=1 Tax=Puccinia coronata f. sp. avenae TaxID=200324 RepID=A0A2N5U4R2_9BASI|nr:hypothetical protein PCASD_12419 [Puccinia coronata f. sp. avenae]